MKRFATALTIAATLCTFAPRVAGAAADTVTLKVAHFLPASSNAHQKLIMPWCEKINKESGGRLKCQIYPSMQLGGTPSQLIDQARDGIADVIWTAATFQAGRFTKTEVFELPFMINSAEKGSPALWDYIQKNSLDEFKGVKLLATHFHDLSPIHLGKKSVKSLEDLKGLKIRVPSRMSAKALAALGALPVQMPAPAVPEAISKNVVDGATLPWEVTTALKMQEICKTHTEPGSSHAGISNTLMVFAMNQTRYNSLPPELKSVIDNNSGRETSRWAGKSWDSFSAQSRKLAIDRHNTINVLSESEYQRWVKATQSVDDGWIKEVGAKGGNGRALLNEAKTLLKKYQD